MELLAERMKVLNTRSSAEIGMSEKYAKHIFPWDARTVT